MKQTQGPTVSYEDVALSERSLIFPLTIRTGVIPVRTTHSVIHGHRDLRMCADRTGGRRRAARKSNQITALGVIEIALRNDETALGILIFVGIMDRTPREEFAVTTVSAEHMCVCL